MSGTSSVAGALAQARIMDVEVTEDTLSVELEDGRTVSVPIVWYPRLAYATSSERSNFYISGSDRGVHWPDLDEDVGVQGLLLGKGSMESAPSFQEWLQQREAKQSKT